LFCTEFGSTAFDPLTNDTYDSFKPALAQRSNFLVEWSGLIAFGALDRRRNIFDTFKLELLGSQNVPIR